MGKLKICADLGARAISRDCFLEDDGTYDVVLDPMVGPTFMKGLEKCNRDARYVVYAAMGGAKVPDFNFGGIFRKSLSILSSTLRARSLPYKTDLVANFME